MIKILHTADWQIGLRASHVASVGEAVRKARMDAARGLVEKANLERVDSLVLAGDIFEDNHIDNALVYEIVRILSASQVPVHVLPGNHDPLSQDSVYKRASWRNRPENIHLLETTAPVPIANGSALLLPAPLSLKKSVEDPTDALQVPETPGGILIGVAHGSLKIEGKYGRDDFPIDLAAATRKGLSYLALGHWHGRYVHGDRTAYSGTLETTKFGENNSGMALMVEFTSAGAAPRVQDFRSGKLQWITHDLELTDGVESDLKKLRQEIGALPHPREQTLFRLRTTGESSGETHLLLKALEEELAAGFLYFEMDRRDLPSSVVQGRLSEIMTVHPYVAGLFESLGRGALDPDLQGVGPEDLASAKRLLSELLMAELEGGA